MIKKLLNKIKNMFSKSDTDITGVFSNEPLSTQEAILKKETIQTTCDYCKLELRGKKSIKDEDGAMYIWCGSCSYVNKIKNGVIIAKDNTKAEVDKALILFKRAGYNVSYFSYSKDGEQHNI